MNESGNSTAQQMLLFIPDIRGFTKFVNETEITHSQHIIEELLEKLIDANEMGLKVSEIEGDAILFYKETENISSSEILAQVQAMYTRFHSHLKMYEHRRICQCGACYSANELKLKFILTYGEVGKNQIKGHSKLFGKEVIIAHRLMKNDVQYDEYLLLTEQLMNTLDGEMSIENVAWTAVEKGKGEYDFGTVGYAYLSLAALGAQVPEPTIENYALEGPKTKVIESDTVIEAPLELVFNVLSDYSIRHHWMVGLKSSDMLNSKISQNGSTHRCLINGNKNDPFFVAHDFQSKQDFVMFTETDRSKGYSIVFTLRSIGPQITRLQKHEFLTRNILKETFFKLFFRKKFIKNNKVSYANLNEYCKTLLNEGKQPYSQIVLN